MKIIKKISRYVSNSMPFWIFVIIYCFFLTGVFVVVDKIKKSNTVSEETVLIELSNGSKVTMSGYSLLDYNDKFQPNDEVYVEVSNDCLPSSVRHDYDAHEKDGQMYAETEWCGSYKANLLAGKIISVK